MKIFLVTITDNWITDNSLDWLSHRQCARPFLCRSTHHLKHLQLYAHCLCSAVYPSPCEYTVYTHILDTDHAALKSSPVSSVWEARQGAMGPSVIKCVRPYTGEGWGESKVTNLRPYRSISPDSKALPPPIYLLLLNQHSSRSNLIDWCILLKTWSSNLAWKSPVI